MRSEMTFEAVGKQGGISLLTLSKRFSVHDVLHEIPICFLEEQEDTMLHIPS